MEKGEKLELLKVILGAVLFALSYIPAFDGAMRIVLILAAYLIAGFEVLKEFVENLIHGEIFDENFLMAVASLGAIVLGEYPEAAAVMILYQLGELLQDIAVEKSRDSVIELMDLRPDWANVERNGKTVRVEPTEVEPGEIIEIKPGEKIPLDGVVIEGFSGINTSALTGESLPRDVEPGGEVISGCVNMTGLLRVKVTSSFAESTVSKILELVENSEENKAKTERFITRFAKIYTPAVVAAAVLLAVIPSLITGNWAVWIHRALTFLVISCPCALVISVPLGFFGGIGGASRNGILFKGGNCLETLAEASVVVFDKTGTLTRGSFSVSAVHPVKVTEAELLDLAAHAECYSNHPAAVSLRETAGEIDRSRVSTAEELAGHGVKAVVDGKNIYVGNARLMESINVEVENPTGSGTVIHAAADGEYLGCIVISDELKNGAKQAITDLRAAGVRKIAMLTGDRLEAGEAAAKELGLDEVYPELLPADKVSKIEQIISENTGKVVFAGDGINDAPVLKRADAGIAMGALGSDAAIEASDIVLMDDAPEKIAKGIRIAKRTMRIVKENVIFALGVKFTVMLLGALGIAGMWAAVFADVGVAFLAILNSLRAMKTENV